MLSSHLSGDTVLHRLPAGAKLAGLAAATVVVLPVAAPAPALAVLAAVAALYAVAGREAVRRMGRVGPLVPVLAVVLVAQGLLASWGEGVAVVARILAMVWLANLVTMTTRMDDMLDTLAVPFAPLKAVGLPPRTVALAVTLVVRFVPVLLEEWGRLAEAWRARTGRRPGIGLLAPFALRVLDLSERVGETLAARYAPAHDGETPPGATPPEGPSRWT